MFEPQPFHVDRPHLVGPVLVDREGAEGPTRAQARGPRWRRCSPGRYVPASTAPDDTDQRIVEAGALLPEGGAVTGWAALRWRAAAWFDGRGRDGATLLDVPLVTPRFARRQPGVSVSQEFLAPRDIEVVDGLPTTSIMRSLVFEMRYAAGLGDAIAALDMACYSDLVSLAEVARHLPTLGPVTGIQQARDALAEGDENAWSPREVLMRGVWTRLAGLGRPLCNTPVFDLDGRHVGTPDLLDPVAGLVGQYNGALHLAGEQVSRDLRGEAAYRALGLECLTMVSADWADLDDYTRRLLEAHSRAVGHTGPRQWTVEPPSWWTPTVTVAQRRALDDEQRERFLRHRRLG